jgi:hypothetical protein
MKCKDTKKNNIFFKNKKKKSFFFLFGVKYYLEVQ